MKKINCSLCQKIVNAREGQNFYVSSAMYTNDANGDFERCDYDNPGPITSMDIVTCGDCESKVEEVRKTLRSGLDK